MHIKPLSIAVIFFGLLACTTKDEDQDWDSASPTTAVGGDTSTGSDDGGSDGATDDGSDDGSGDDGSVVEDSGTANDTADAEPQEATIWTGPTITFTKENFAVTTDSANQDAITDLVVLTRGGRGSLYNVVTEASASPTSPSGTEWAKGTTADIDSLTFQHLKGAAGGMNRLPNTEFVLHLIEEDIYIDVKFLSWTSGNSSGGGFSYERSTAE